jgi:hypothetical protein
MSSVTNTEAFEIMAVQGCDADVLSEARIPLSNSAQISALTVDRTAGRSEEEQP